MSGYITGKSRTQVTLFPEVVDDFISEENTVRVLDVFVDELDLIELGFERAKPKQVGRPGYDPATMLKLYLYGYLNRIQSSRRLEREALRNVELMWLTRRLAPDFKTIADFRKDNSKGIKNVCRTFIDICRKLDMFKDAVVAVDGSKFKAVNNKSKNFTPSKLKFHIERVEKHIQRYLTKLDEVDNTESSETKETINDKINSLKSTLEEFKELKKKVEEAPDKQISETDPDSRLMKTRSNSRQVCYNVQSAVDAKHHLIVAHKVTNVPDRGKLHEMGVEAQDALHNKDLTVLADRGYYSSLDIKDSEDAGMNVLVPSSDTSASEKKGIFNRSMFKYDSVKDVYICPANEELPHRMTGIEKGKTMKRYMLDVYTCRACKLKPECTTSPSVRRIARWEHQYVLDKMAQRLKAEPDAMLIRKQTVEHPFGTIKMWMGSTHFLTKRFKNVSTEMDLHVLAYNLRRMMTIFGSKELMKEMMA